MRRLAKATPRPINDWVQFLSPAEVDMVGEPESFVVLPGGRFVPVLAHDDGACFFLVEALAGAQCSVHQERPLSCRAYPFDRPDDLSGEETLTTGKASADKGLALHPELLCPPSTGCAEVVMTAASAQFQSFRHIVVQRDEELHAHAALVAGWNRKQKLRRRMGKPLLDKARLLRELQLSE